MSIFNRIAKDFEQYYGGKLSRFPGLWTYEPPKKAPVLKEKDRDGRTVYLVHKQSVLCENPAKSDELLKSEQHEAWWMPWSECRKCEHYRKARQGRRGYAWCAWAHRQRTSGTKGQE